MAGTETCGTMCKGVTLAAAAAAAAAAAVVVFNILCKLRH